MLERRVVAEQEVDKSTYHYRIPTLLTKPTAVDEGGHAKYVVSPRDLQNS